MAKPFELLSVADVDSKAFRDSLTPEQRADLEEMSPEFLKSFMRMCGLHPETRRVRKFPVRSPPASSVAASDEESE